MSNSLSWIGVVGMGRSGTTFLATALAAAPATAYLHEPFNPSCGVVGVDWSSPTLLDRNLKPNAEATHAIEQLLRFRRRLRRHVPSSDPAGRRLVKCVSGGRGPLNLLKARMTLNLRHGILKDPVGIGLFPYLQDAHGFRNLLVLKHPVAQIAGLRRVGWTRGPDFLRSRPYLYDKLEERERAELERDDLPPIESLAWVWRGINGILIRLAVERGWTVKTIESVSECPAATLPELYDVLGLPWTRRCERRIARMTAGNGGTGATARCRTSGVIVRRCSRHSVSKSPSKTDVASTRLPMTLQAAFIMMTPLH